MILFRFFKILPAAAISCTLILFLLTNDLSAQVAGFTAPDTVYTNSPVTITNTTTGTGSWYWSFCSGNALSNPLGTNIGNPGGLLNIPGYTTLLKDGNTCYSFISNVGSQSIIRYNHGTSFSNNPVSWTNLGNFGLLNDSLLGVKICHDNGQWIGFVLNNNRIIRLNFGASLANTPVATLAGSFSMLFVAHCIDIFNEGGIWVGYISSWGNNKLVRLNFGNSLLNTPVATDLGSPGALNNPGVFRIISENGLWYGLFTNQANSTMSRLTFGNSLLNVPTGTNLGVVCPASNPGGLTLIRDCEGTVGFQLNYSLSSPDKIWRLNFPSGITGPITAASLGNIGAMTQPCQFSELTRVGDTLFLYNTNRQGTLTRLRFLPCNNASVPSSVLFNPPVYSYNQPGIYNVELIVNEGLPSQSVFCKNIVVTDPPATAAFTAPDTVCTGSQVNITNQSTGGTTWYWSFCSGSALSNPLGVNIGNPGGLLNINSYMTLVKDGNTCYSFITNQGSKAVTRYNHGTSFSNNPVSWTNLGGFGMLGDTVMGIKINYDNGQWIGIVNNNNRLVRLNFGASLANTPVATLLGPYTLLYTAHCLDIFKEGGNWVGFITCSWGNRLVRLEFGNSLLNPPVLIDLGTPGSMYQPSSFRIILENGTWYGLVVNYGNSTMTRLTFGNSLFNTPTGVNIGVVCPAIAVPGGITLIRDCEGTSGFQLNYSVTSPDLIWRLSFPSGITGPVSGTSLGNIGALSRPNTFSELFRVGDTLFLYVSNRQNFTLSRLRFLPCSNASVPSSTLFTPPAYSYNQAGTYNIQLIVNEGLPTQASLCKSIVVMPQPVVNLGNDVSICPGNSVTLDAGANFSSYLWSTGATTRTITVSAAGTYSVTVTRWGCSANDAINVSLLSGPVVNLGPNVTICAGQSHTFDAGPCTGCSFQWGNLTTGQPNIGTGQTYTTGTAGNYTVTVVGPNSCMGRDTCQLFVQNTIPVTVSISASANPVCSGSQVTFTATALFGGSSPVYEWKVNGLLVGINSQFFSYTPSNGDCVVCTLTSTAACTTGSPATSNQICMTVSPNLPAGVTIAPTANPVCAGTFVTFNASPIYGGTSPTYQWQVNGVNVTGATNAAYSFTPSDGDLVTCTMTSSEVCTIGNPANSLPVIMTVHPILPVSVSVSPSETTVCAGTGVTYTATPGYGGITPSYQWKVNGTDAGTNNAVFNYTPSPGDLVTVVMTSSEECTSGNPATSPPVSVTVSPNLPVGISVSASFNPVCAGSHVLFTAFPSQGGNSPLFEWKVNGSVAGTNSQFFSYIPSNGDCMVCKLTSNAACITGNPATSNQICMMVNPNLAVSITIVPSANPVCAGTSVTFNASPAHGGTLPAYQWQVNTVSISGATNAFYSYIPLDGDQVTCTLTSSEVCTVSNPVSSLPVTMTVHPILPVSVSVSPSAMVVCAGTLITYNASPVYGGFTPSYQWKVNGLDAGANNAVLNYAPSSGDQVTCVMTSSEGCTSGNPATSPPVAVTVNPNLPVSISAGASSNPFCAGSAVNFNATANWGGATPSYQWQVNGTNVINATNASYAYNPAAGDLVSCELISSETCTLGNPASSNVITMIATPVLPAGITIAATPNPYCPGTSVTFTATPIHGGTAPAFQWMVNANNVTNATNASYTYNPAAGDLVSCTINSNLACVTNNPATSAVIQMAILPAPVVSFNRCFDSITIINAKPFMLKGGLPRGGTYSGPGVTPATAIFDPAIAGAGTHTLTYSFTNVYTCVSTATTRIFNLPFSIFNCGSLLTDPRDNRQYATFILPNGKCWMASNLDFGFQISNFTPQTDNCLIEKYSHSSLVISNSLYQWDELMQYQTAEGSQGLCPPGWHIPSANEWTALLAFYDGSSQAAGPMKDLFLVSGFHSLQQGFYYLNHTWAFTTGMDAGSMYWTSTSSGTDRAVARGLNEMNHSVSFYPALRGNAFGVRCCRD